MKFQIDLFVNVAAYVGISWAYAQLPEPNWWVYAVIMMFVAFLDIRSYKIGMDRGAALMQRVMRETLEEKGWEIVRNKP